MSHYSILICDNGPRIISQRDRLHKPIRSDTSLSNEGIWGLRTYKPNRNLYSRFLFSKVGRFRPFEAKSRHPRKVEVESRRWGLYN